MIRDEVPSDSVYTQILDRIYTSMQCLSLSYLDYSVFCIIDKHHQLALIIFRVPCFKILILLHSHLKQSNLSHTITKYLNGGHGHSKSSNYDVGYWAINTSEPTKMMPLQISKPSFTASYPSKIRKHKGKLMSASPGPRPLMVGCWSHGRRYAPGAGAVWSAHRAAPARLTSWYKKTS